MRMPRLLLAGSLILPPANIAEARAPQPVYADPADVITADLAFARLAKDKGMTAAYRATMAADAVMFVPQRVAAIAWVKDHKDPAQFTKHQPREVWMSCDGSYALVDGVWSRGAEHGWFSSVWQRQRNGGYKWVLQDGDAAKDADAASDSISAHVADCPKAKDKTTIAAWNNANAPGYETNGERLLRANSADMTLHWETSDNGNVSHNLSVWIWKDGDMQQIHITDVSAPQPLSPPPLAPSHR